MVWVVAFLFWVQCIELSFSSTVFISMSIIATIIGISLNTS
jgi:hypothetical protein